ncbi:MAG: fatty acid desaturase [Candidatus Latescibacterota bacterium]|nr:fatty acid desaturase [Candidatus Latescibacterota bacterium]
MNAAAQPETFDGEALTDQEVLTEGPQYNEPPKKTRVKWYRCRITRDELAKLNRRSDFLGFAQTLGYLGVLAAFSGAAVYSSLHWPWYATTLLVFLNGHFWHFLINGFHELIHDSVFKTRWLNRFFLRIFSFLGWYNHHHFWASHTEHHKYTLHPPDDLEVVLPHKIDFKALRRNGLINYRYPYDQLRGKFKAFAGHVPDDQWSSMLFPASDPKRRQAFTNWERILLIGHLSIAAVALALGYWAVLLVFTFPKSFGMWLQFYCNSAQHVGLQDKVTDFRLCCRTIYLNPFFQFLYWHMNYHTEHHMYAAVPCYRLGQLHRLIQHEMPYCPRGLRETWRHIGEILQRQEREPGYYYTAELPTPGIRRDAESAPIATDE